MFARRKRINVPVSVSNCCPVLSVVVPQTLRSFDSLCVEELKGSFTGEKILASVDDVYLLLMQKDFEKRYPLEYKNFVQLISEQSQSSLVKSKLPKMSDKQLMSFIKSRHVQQPSELRAWYNYLSSQYDLQLDAYNKAQKDASDVSTPPVSDSVPPTSSPTPDVASK